MIATMLSGCSKNACTCASTPPLDPAIGAMIVVLPAASATRQISPSPPGTDAAAIATTAVSPPKRTQN